MSNPIEQYHPSLHIAKAALICVLFLPSVEGSAQSPNAEPQFSQGPLAFTPAAFSYKAVGGVEGAAIRMKRPGFKQLEARFVSPPGRPNYDKATDFSGLAASLRPSGPLDIDAMSVGLDWVMADSAGHVSVDDKRWGIVSFSVTHNSKGLPNSTISKESTRGSDIFAFIPRHANNSLASGPKERFENKTVRALDSTEIAKDMPSGAEIDAFDIHMNLYRLDKDIYDTVKAWGNRYGLAQPKFYFSVSAATADRIPDGWNHSAKKSGATIFERTWLGERWSVPKVFLDWSQFKGVGPTFDVVAIAVDARQKCLLLSIVEPEGSTWKTYRNPLLYFSYAATESSAELQVYSYGDDDPVSDDADLKDTDTIDGVCSLDPTFVSPKDVSPVAFMIATPVNRQGYKYGTTTLTFPKVGSLSASAFRDHRGSDPATGILFQMYAAGWPQAGPGDGLTVHYLSVPPGRMPLEPRPRARNAACPGSPVECVVGIPLVGGKISYGCHWFAGVTPFVADVAEAFPAMMMTPFVLVQ